MTYGNGFLLQLPFADNGFLSSPRAFLQIGEKDNYIHLLNVSTIENKKHKLLMKSNEKLNIYKPPFWKKSMVKLDAIYKVEKCKELGSYLLSNGRVLDQVELQRIQSKFNDYKKDNQILESVTNSEQLQGYVVAQQVAVTTPEQTLGQDQQQ